MIFINRATRLSETRQECSGFSLRVEVLYSQCRNLGRGFLFQKPKHWSGFVCFQPTYCNAVPHPVQSSRTQDGALQLRC